MKTTDIKEDLLMEVETGRKLEMSEHSGK